MAIAERQVIATLNELFKWCKASEKGFTVAAVGIHNRALKLLFKTYAQQRFEFAKELHAEIFRLDGKPKATGSFRAAIHRGWIDLTAAMIIGQENRENAVLAECVRGESFIVRAYQEALAKELPPAVRTLVERQSEQIKAVSEQVNHLRGGTGSQLVVRLFDRPEDVEQAVRALQDAGFAQDKIETVALDQVMKAYQGGAERNASVETASAGALLGILIGGLIGLVAGLSSAVIPTMETLLLDGYVQTVLFATLLGALAGGAIVSLISILIGLAVTEEDNFLYDDSIRHGKTLLMLDTDNQRATRAARILYQVNATARAHHPHQPQARIIS